MKKIKLSFVSGILIGVLSGLLVTCIIVYFNVTETNLVNLDLPPPPLIFEDHKPIKDGTIFHISGKYKFKNYGLKSGFIDNIVVKPAGLKIFPEVEIIYIDKTPLKWREEREIKIEYIIKITNNFLAKLFDNVGYNTETFTKFNIFIYDNSGKQIFTGAFELGLTRKSHKKRQ